MTAGAVHVPVALPSQPLHSGLDVTQFHSMHIMAAIFPLTAGLLLYGWRAVVLFVLVVGSAALAIAAWRRIGTRGGQLRYSHVLWLATLLALTLPVHLVSPAGLVAPDAPALWPVAAAVGVALVGFIWVLGGISAGRVHPVLVAYFLLIVFFHQALVPHWVLQRSNVLTGDALDTISLEYPDTAGNAWIAAPPVEHQQALWLEPASQRLIFYTTGIEFPEGAFGAWITLDSLIRDRMPPLEDLIIGGHPGPIGTSSAIAVLVGGLFLLYRGLVDFRIPLLICIGAFACFLVLPIPVVITEAGPEWRWLAAREPGVGWATAVTFANYQLMAGPALFMAFFLATAPAVRPMSRRGRGIYALLIGILTGVFQLYTSVSFGPYLALLLVSLVTPLLDRRLRPRPLV
jgi:Na+-translocating ferredoxin:NAD+ oxidoreductase RnfD subunit